MRSMTGFGNAAGFNEQWKIQVQLHSVNHKRLDVYVVMPSFAKSFEGKIRQRLADTVGRGKINIDIRIDGNNGSRGEWQINKALIDSALSYAAQCSDLQTMTPSVVLQALQLPEAMQLEPYQFSESDEELLMTVFEEALAIFLANGQQEGNALAEGFHERLNAFKKHLTLLKEISPRVQQELEQKLRDRLAELLGEEALNEHRLMEELVYFTNRMSIDEELNRLEIHLQKIDHLLEQEGAIGRECDFYFQEMNREVNTSGSKINDAEGSIAVVQMKVLLDQMREQIQNIV